MDVKNTEWREYTNDWWNSNTMHSHCIVYDILLMLEQQYYALSLYGIWYIVKCPLRPMILRVESRGAGTMGATALKVQGQH